MKTSPLQAVHRSLGAQLVPVHGWEVPAHYGKPEEEHQAVRKAVGISDLSYRGRVVVSGADRAKFLQGLLTNDVLKLTEGQGLYAAILNAKGRMLADLKVYAIPEVLLLDIDREITDKTLEILNRYKLVSKAKLEDVSETTVHLALYGPSATPLLEKSMQTAPLPKGAEFSCPAFSWHGEQVTIVRSFYTGEEGYEIIGPLQTAPDLWKALYDTGLPLGIKPVGTQALESLRVEAGIPRYGVDMDEQIFPPEAGLEKKAISYTKGCYVGQETIARIKTYGQVHRKLMGLILEQESRSVSLPAPHEKIYKDGDEIGFVTSAVFSPTLGRNIALGYIRRKSIGPQLEVFIGSGETSTRITAKVVELPFYSRPQAQG